MKKVILLLSVSILSISVFASNIELKKQSVGPENINEQSIAGAEGDQVSVVGMRYNKSSKAFIPFNGNQYYGKMFLNIVRDTNGNMYHQDGNRNEHKIERNRYKTYGGIDVSGYSYMCSTSWEILFFNY